MHTLTCIYPPGCHARGAGGLAVGAGRQRERPLFIWGFYYNFTNYTFKQHIEFQQKALNLTLWQDIQNSTLFLFI